MDRDSNDEHISLSSLSFYQEMCRLADKDCFFSSSFRHCPFFIRDVYEMVVDSSTDSVVLWSENGKNFIIWNES